MSGKRAVIIGVSLMLSHAAMAAKPTSITFKETKTKYEEVKYQRYVVKCSDGKSNDISAWNNRKLWCVGDIISGQGCDKRQVKIAKRVCRSS